MKNTFGQSITVTLFGESHGAAIGAVLDGMAPGIPVQEEEIAKKLSRRRPCGPTDTPRQEPDSFQIVSGVFQGKTTGTPLCILIPNQDTKSKDYTYGVARPSHADYAAFCKYHGFEDYRGGGHFSGRITAALVAVGAILSAALEPLRISIGTHIQACGDVQDLPFCHPEQEIPLLAEKMFPVLDDNAGRQMQEKILEARKDQDSIGGITQTAICGLPEGLGEPWFDSVEGLLSHALFSIGGIKGVEFGSGFALSTKRGSTCNDAWTVRDSRVVSETNHSGGINGGITNGMPVLFRCAVKPTPSIGQPQQTVCFTQMQPTQLTIQGRHDPAIIRRICPVIDSVSTIVIADLLAQRYGTDVFLKGVTPWSTD